MKIVFFSFVFALLNLCHVGVALADYVDPLDVPAREGAKADKATLLQVVRTPGNRLVAVGRYGVIFISEDAGKRWMQVKAPVSTDLVSVYFPTAKRGWAVGHGGIVLSTENSGDTWSVQLDGRKAAMLVKSYFESRISAGDALAQSGLEDALRFIEEGPGRPFLDVWFENETTGYLVGAYNLIFRTRDGGKSWDFLGDRVDNPGALHINAIREIGGTLFLAGEQGKVWKFDKSQDKFVTVPTPYQGSWFGLVGTPQSLLAFGLRGNVWRSGDFGANWTRIDSGLDSSVTAGIVLDDGRIVLTTMSGECLVSSDEGLTFSRIENKGDHFPLFGISPLPEKMGIALVGARGVRIISLR